MAQSLKAHTQWANRPADERFGSMGSMLEFAKKKRAHATQAIRPWNKLRVDHDGENVFLKIGSKQIPFTHWSFHQLCARSNAPHNWISRVPAKLAAANLRHALKQNADERELKMLFTRMKGDLQLRGISGPNYTRIWDYQVVERLIDLAGNGWDVPPAYDPAKFGVNLKKGNAGLYCGDRDMFAFLVNEDRRIDDGSEHGLARGFFLSNSEVGYGAWKLTTFLYQFVCGNHIVWGMKDAATFSVPHIGDADAKSLAVFKDELQEYKDESPKLMEDTIRAAQNHKLGNTDEEVEEEIFSNRILPRKVIRAALEAAPEWGQHFGDPHTAWGASQLVTVISQNEEFAGDRVQLDLASNKILKLATA